MGDRETQTVAKGARSITIAVLISRLLGLVREQVLAGLFGAGFQMDAYVVAYRIPNLLRDLLAEGALASAFVKVFSEWQERYGMSATWILASRAITTIGLLVLGLIVLGECLTPYLVRLLAPGFGTFAGKTELAVFLTRIMFPFLMMVSISAVFGGMLNSLGYFFLPAISSAFFNLVSVSIGIALYFFLPRFKLPEITGMAIGVVLGGAVQAGMQWPRLRRSGFRFFPAITFNDPGVREIFRLMVPSMIGLSAVQLNIFVNTYFASLCGEGAVSWLAYAFRLMYVPLGLFGVALQVAILPIASRQVARGDLEGLKETYTSCLLMGASLALPSAAGLIILAKPIVRLIFEHGHFTRVDTIQTAAALALFSVGLLAYALTKVSVPVFYALGRPKIPMFGSFIAVGVNLFVIVFTIKVLSFRAIAMGTSLGLTVQAIFLISCLFIQMRGLNLRRFFKGLLRIFLCTGVMSGLAYLLRMRIEALNGVLFAFSLLAGILICASLYFFIAKFFAPAETLYLLDIQIGRRFNLHNLRRNFPRK